MELVIVWQKHRINVQLLMFPASLKSRIVLTLVFTVVLTSVLFGAGMFVMKQQLEEATFGEMVREQFNVVLSQVEDGKDFESHLFQNWDFYIADNLNTLDPKIRSLPQGSHHSIRSEDRWFQVEVGEWQGQPAILTYDISDWEAQEHFLLEMLLYGIVLILLVGIIMAVKASESILSPVQKLKNQLLAIQPSDKNIRIGNAYQGNEVQVIANAVDSFLERLDQFVERERSFSNAASHELRTPLSVVMGAIDVLETNDNNPVATRAISRISRATNDMLAFVEATLFLSREDAKMAKQDECDDVAKWVREWIDDNKTMLQERKIQIETTFQSPVKLAVPNSVVKIVVNNLLRNALNHTHSGSISIVLDLDQFVVEDTGQGIPADNLPYVFDRNFSTQLEGTGMGLYLVKRICDRFNWGITITSEVGVGTQVTVNFNR